MDRKSFLMSLPLMGFVGKMLGGEKKDFKAGGVVKIEGITGNTAANGVWGISHVIEGDGRRYWARDVKFVGNIPDGSLCYFNYERHSATKLKNIVLKQKPTSYNTIGVRQGNDVQIGGMVRVGVYTGKKSLF